MPSAAEIVVTVTDAKPVRELLATVRAVLRARAGGADTYEADGEIDAMEWALARLEGVAGRVCSECGAPFEPKHRHLDDVVWIEAPARG